MLRADSALACRQQRIHQQREIAKSETRGQDNGDAK
jgi:hypothetical protein